MRESDFFSEVALGPIFIPIEGITSQPWGCVLGLLECDSNYETSLPQEASQSNLSPVISMV